MKTLDQIEPRTPISSLPFVIVEPGSYYLTGPLVLADTNAYGISIFADNVQIDLMGYTLTGPGIPGSGVAIYQNGSIYSNAWVRNGAVKNWIHTLGTEAISLGSRAKIEDVAVYSCNRGIKVDDHSEVRRSRIYSNISPGAFYGVVAKRNCVIEDTVISDNQALSAFAIGIQALEYSSIRNCIIANNSAAGQFMGVFAGLGSAIHDCTVNDNYGAVRLRGILSLNNVDIFGCRVLNNSSPGTELYGIDARGNIRNCTVRANTGTATAVVGILAGIASTVENCTVEQQNGEGIRTVANCLVARNFCDQNSGIGIIGNSMVAEDNVVMNSRTGIVSTANSVIVRNTTRIISHQHYVFSPSDVYGPVISFSGPLTNESALANFQR